MAPTLELKDEILKLKQGDHLCLPYDRQRAEASESHHLAEVRHHLAAIVESSDDAIISKDLNGVITSWNKAAERLYGYTANEIIGRSVTVLIPSDRQDEEPRILEQLRRGERIDHYETIRQRKDGSLVEISLTVSPIKDADGKVVGASKIARDISERRAAERALREARAELVKANEQLEQRVCERTAELAETNSQLEAFVYSIAHDLRAPLRSMQAFSTMLLDEYTLGLDDMARNYARRIVRAAESMDAMVLDLLAYGRAARSTLALGPISVDSAWAAAIEQNEEAISEKKAQVETVRPLPRVRAHDGTLTQALANLLGNALKFGRPEVRPVIRLRTEERQGLIRIWVEDNGIGIAPEYHDRVFRVFERLHGKQYPGTGIGLSIVRKGIERMAGRVGVESKVGAGSRFWIELPKA